MQFYLAEYKKKLSTIMFSTKLTSFSYFEGKRIKKVFVFPKDLFTDLVGQVTKDQYFFASEYYYILDTTYYNRCGEKVGRKEVLQEQRKEIKSSRRRQRTKIIYLINKSANRKTRRQT